MHSLIANYIRFTIDYEPQRIQRENPFLSALPERDQCYLRSNLILKSIIVNRYS